MASKQDNKRRAIELARGLDELIRDLRAQGEQLDALQARCWDVAFGRDDE